MLGIMFQGQGRLRVEDVPEPQAGVGDVKIATAMSGICGTDLHSFGKPGVVATTPPADVPPGHEICGVVVEVGAGVSGFSVGDRVVGNHIVGCGLCEYCHRGAPHHCPTRRRIGRELSGTMGQFVVGPERNFFHMPDWMSFAEGTLVACNFGTAYSALKRARVCGGHRVAIFGLGPVGICAAMTARGMGASVVGIDLSAARRDLAAKLTGCDVLDPTEVDVVAAIVESGRADVAVDATGVSVAQNQALDVTRPDGAVVLLGVGGDTTISPFRQIIAKDLHVLGSYTYKLGEFEEIVRFIRVAGIELGSLVSGVYPPTDAVEAFAAATSADRGKILFTWDEVNRDALAS
jgi:threonine dehydrogenase-like Zn-dependent dehydrogenase